MQHQLQQARVLHQHLIWPSTPSTLVEHVLFVFFLQALEKLSHEHAHSLLSNGGLLAVSGVAVSHQLHQGADG